MSKRYSALKGTLNADAPAFKIVASTRTKSIMYAAFGITQAVE